MSNSENSLQEMLEKDYFALLESKGLQKPTGPIGHNWFDKPESILRHEQAYQDLEKWIPQQQLRQLVEERKKNRTGYEHVIEPFKSTRYSPLLDFIYFGEYPTGFFNAQARQTPNGYLCLLNLGMRQFLYATAMAAFFSVVDPDRSDPEASDPKQRSIRDVSRFAYASANCLRFVRGFTEGYQFARVQPSSHTRTSMSWGARSFGAMRDFVVAHEIAHIALGHLDKSPTHMIKTSLGELEVVENTHTHEYEADQLAQDILFELAHQQGIGVLTGGISFLAVNRILSTFRRAVLGNSLPDATTHPSAEDRFEALFQHLKRHVSTQVLTHIIDFAAPYESLRMAMEFVELTENGIYFPVDRFNRHLDTLKAKLE